MSMRSMPSDDTPSGAELIAAHAVALPAMPHGQNARRRRARRGRRRSTRTPSRWTRSRASGSRTRRLAGADLSGTRFARPAPDDCELSGLQPRERARPRRRAAAGGDPQRPPHRPRAHRGGADRRDLQRLPHRPRVVRRLDADRGHLRRLHAAPDRLPGGEAGLRALPRLRHERDRPAPRPAAPLRAAPQPLPGAQGIESLRGAAMEWPDIVEHAGVLAAALGIRVLED